MITHGIHFLRISRSGKAAALNAALRSATGEILFFTDVRQRFTPNSLRDLVARFAESEVGVVSGELVILDSATGKATDASLYWRYEKWMRKRLSEIDSTFGATGCIYAMRRKLAPALYLWRR